MERGGRERERYGEMEGGYGGRYGVRMEGGYGGRTTTQINVVKYTWEVMEVGSHGEREGGMKRGSYGEREEGLEVMERGRYGGERYGWRDNYTNKCCQIHLRMGRYGGRVFTSW